MILAGPRLTFCPGACFRGGVIGPQGVRPSGGRGEIYQLNKDPICRGNLMEASICH